MNHASEHDEQQLIAFHLGESCDERAIRARIESDADFAALSESVAHTLRVFSADPVPAPDADAAWDRLRPTLPSHEPAATTSRWRNWLTWLPIGALAALVFAFGLRVHHRRSAPRVDEAGVLHLREPVQSASAEGMAQHLDRAERWLTVVNHTTDPLDSTTRDEGRQLLVQNAVYLQEARLQNDTPDTVVLERLGRVLTTANHAGEGGLQLRVQMNTDGLLFELRILRQNQTAPNGDLQ